MDYYACLQVAAKKAKNDPVPSPAAMRLAMSTVGYNTLMDAMFQSLKLLMPPLWPATQRRTVESFVLQGLDVIPRTAGIPAKWATYDDGLVTVVEEYMKPRYYEPVFCAAVLCKWRSNAVRSVLRARGVLQTWIAAYDQQTAEFESRSQSTACVNAPSPPAPRRRRRSRSLRSALAVAPLFIAAWSIRRWTKERTKRRAATRRRRGWQLRKSVTTRPARRLRWRDGERNGRLVPTIDFIVEHLSELGGARVCTDLHCLGCTAGAGSSCTGQLA